MEIIETSIFTRQALSFFSDDEYRLLKSALVQKPDMGKVIPHSGGLRKIRWSLGDKGKRGGTRIIYFWAISKEQLLMLFMYAKNQTEDLTVDQLKQLESIMKKEYP